MSIALDLQITQTALEAAQAKVVQLTELIRRQDLQAARIMLEAAQAKVVHLTELTNGQELRATQIALEATQTKVAKLTKLISRQDLQDARTALEAAQIKVTQLTEALAEQEKGNSKHVVFAELKQEYAYGIFKKAFHNNPRPIHPSLECWDACMRIMSHITENYHGYSWSNRKISVSVRPEKATIMKHVMSELCATITRLRAEYLDPNAKE